jgi:hypothetical protein
VYMADGDIRDRRTEPDFTSIHGFRLPSKARIRGRIRWSCTPPVARRPLAPIVDRTPNRRKTSGTQSILHCDIHQFPAAAVRWDGGDGLWFPQPRSRSRAMRLGGGEPSQLRQSWTPT